MFKGLKVEKFRLAVLAVYGFKGSRDHEIKGLEVQKFKSSRAQGFMGLWVQGLKGSRDHEIKGLEVQKFRSSEVQKFRSSRVQ